MILPICHSKLSIHFNYFLLFFYLNLNNNIKFKNNINQQLLLFFPFWINASLNVLTEKFFAPKRKRIKIVNTFCHYILFFCFVSFSSIFIIIIQNVFVYVYLCVCVLVFSQCDQIHRKIGRLIKWSLLMNKL